MVDAGDERRGEDAQLLNPNPPAHEITVLPVSSSSRSAQSLWPVLVVVQLLIQVLLVYALLQPHSLRSFTSELWCTAPLSRTLIGNETESESERCPIEPFPPPASPPVVCPPTVVCPTVECPAVVCPTVECPTVVCPPPPSPPVAPSGAPSAASPSILNPAVTAGPFSALPVSHHTDRLRASLNVTSPDGASVVQLSPGQALLDLLRPYHDSSNPQHTKLLYHARPAPLTLTDRSVVVFDGRFMADLILVLRHTLYLLGPQWGLVIFHAAHNLQWFRDSLEVSEGGWGEHIKFVEVDNLGYAQANSLPTSAAFYMQIPTTHMLMVQADALLLRSTYLPGVSSTAFWLDWMNEYHCMGAPWSWCWADWCKACGNGGATYRRVSTMMQLVATAPLQCGDRHCSETAPWSSPNVTDWEDTWISRRLDELHQEKNWTLLTDQSQMARFSIEVMDFPDVTPVFVHSAWKYLKDENRVIDILSHALQYYPE